MSGKLTVLLFIFLLAAPELIFSHSGGHAEKNHSSGIEDVTPLNDSIYAVSGVEDTKLPIPTDDTLSSSLSSSDIFRGEALLTDLGIASGEPMIRFKEKIDQKHKHSQHEKQKQHVENATHEWVSPDAKGRGVAVGITVISGLAFAGLSFFRIWKGNAKDPQ